MTVMADHAETTLRAVVDGKGLAKVRLPAAVEITRGDAATVAVWARPFSSTCITDVEILVNDVRPSQALMAVGDLPTALARRIRPLLVEARRHGFGLRLMRDTAMEPYALSVVRRAVDVPQLTIPYRSMRVFLQALNLLNVEGDVRGDPRIAVDLLSERLAGRVDECMEEGVAHYREHALRIVEYARANGAAEIVWGPERRGAPVEE